MPEGDTLRRLASRIEGALLGQTVTASTFRHPRLALVDLTGRRLLSSDATGKHLFCRFDDEMSMHVHLLMQGRVRIGSVPRIEEWRRRFEITFGDITMTGVDIPILGMVRTDREQMLTGHLGPDLCGSYDPEIATARLLSVPHLHLGAALLDQRVIAGFGNIYAVETPYICGISPFTKVGEINQLDALLTVGAALIRTNAQRGPQNTTGKMLGRPDHYVIDSRIKACRICGSKLKRLTGETTPWRRRTAWCPSCQAESHTTVDIDRASKLLALHPARRMVDFATGTLTEPTNHRVTPASSRPRS